jgi:hypothetical protein
MFAGAGYVADDYLTYVRDVSLGDALAPDLVGLGSIAFLRESGEVWVMRADGSDQRRLYAAGDAQSYTYASDLSWSPDATRLSFNVPHYGDADGGTMELVIIDMQGNMLVSVPGVAGRGWSSDGMRVGTVSGAQPQQMGGGWKGVPGWVDVTTGATHLIGDAAYFQQDPPAFNFDGTLLLLTQTAEDGLSRGIVVMDLDGQEQARVEPPEGVYYGSPLWAPESNRIAFHVATRRRTMRSKSALPAQSWPATCHSAIRTSAGGAAAATCGAACGARWPQRAVWLHGRRRHKRGVGMGRGDWRAGSRVCVQRGRALERAGRARDLQLRPLRHGR